MTSKSTERTDGACLEDDGDMDRYLLFIWGGIEPEIRGPFTEDQRVKEAKKLRKAEGDEHGYFPLNIEFGKPVIGSYSGAFFEEGE